MNAIAQNHRNSGRCSKNAAGGSTNEHLKMKLGTKSKLPVTHEITRKTWI
jgi:hypothetical protein